MWRLKRKHNTQSSNFHLDQVCWRKFLCYEFSNKPKVQKVIMLKYFREWRESLFQRDSRGCHCLHVSMWKGKTVYLTCTSTETMDAAMLNFRKASEESVTQSTSVRTIKQMSLLQSDICVCVRSDYSRAVSPNKHKVSAETALLSPLVCARKCLYTTGSAALSKVTVPHQWLSRYHSFLSTVLMCGDGLF